MSKRRQIGEVIRLDDEDEGEPYLGLIDTRVGDPCPLCVADPGHDPKCSEWPVVVVLDAHKQATGARVFHVCESRMSDPE
jgi:hypothetical protein